MCVYLKVNLSAWDVVGSFWLKGEASGVKGLRFFFFWYQPMSWHQFGLKSPAGMPDQFEIENSACFSVSASYANFGVFGPWSRVAHF